VHSVLKGFETELRTIELAAGGARGFRSAGTSKPGAEVQRWSDHSRELFHALVLGVRDYVRTIGYERVLIGLSGAGSTRRCRRRSPPQRSVRRISSA
jgi:hypothetical protein